MHLVTVAWAWLKKWWKVLLFPLGILIWIVGRATARKTVTVVSPELSQHQMAREAAERETQTKLRLAGEKRVAELDAIDRRNAEVIAKLNEAEARRAEALKDDPIALNKFLKEVGQGVRNKTKT